MRKVLMPAVSALLLMCLIAFALWTSDQSQQQQFQAGNRLTALHQLSVVRARLEAELNSRLFLTSGLITHISLHPDIGQQEFHDLARGLITGQTGIRAIRLARNTVVSHVYPVEGAADAVGLRLLDVPEQSAAVERAIRARKTVVAGPVNLANGAVAFIGRTPIYTTPPGKPPGSGEYWGLASILISRDDLLRQAGIVDSSRNLQIAIRGKDGLGPFGEVFFGDESIFRCEPVLMAVSLPNGAWQLAAVPIGGWPRTAPGSWQLRISYGLLTVLTGILIWLLVSNRYELRDEIEERRQAEKALRESERKLQTLMGNLPGMAYRCANDRDWTMGFVSEGSLDLTGYAPSDLIANRKLAFNELVHPEDREPVWREVQRALEAKREFQLEYRIQTAEGREKWVWERGVGVYAGGGQLVALEGFISDMTDRKRLEHELRLLSQQDGLTGIANRRYFDQRFAVEWRRADRTRSPLSIVVCDIDHFKPYNDTYGHQLGDDCLKAVARVLSESLNRPADFVARYGGEEFVVVLPDTSAKGAATVAERVRSKIEALRIPHSGSAIGPYLTVSLGVGTCRPEPSLQPEELVAAADDALYQAKRGGRNCVKMAGVV